MRLVGCMACKNEDWIIGLAARVALMWCDALVILNNGSVDASAAILLDLMSEFPGRVHVRYVGGAWDEMSHRQTMLECARKMLGTHFAIVDADEVLSGNLLGTIRAHVQVLGSGALLQLPGYNMRGGLDSFHANGIWGKRWFTTAFADDKRLGWSGDCFHHREPGGMLFKATQPFAQGQGGVMHLWGSSERRLRAKHAAYKMIETLRWPDKARASIDQMYSQSVNPAANMQFEQDWRYETAPASWWAPYAHLMHHVHLAAIPWQERFCRQMYAEHGAERFAGLDLFGICGLAEVA